MPIDFQNQIVSVFICLAASVVEFSTTADGYSANVDTYGENRVNWALACGIVSMFLCAIALALTRFLLNRPAFIDVLLSLGLLGIWIFGASFNTSANGCFVNPGNGYFATWIALVSAANYAYLSLGQIRDKLQQHLPSSGPVVVLVASIVELSTAADLYVHTDFATSAFDEPRLDWAIACGCVSAFFCFLQLVALQLRFPIAETSGKALAAFLVALWAAGAGVNTSAKGPFSSTGNGYFFSWLAFAAAINFAHQTFVGQREVAYQAVITPANPAEPPLLMPPPVGTGAGYQPV